jgi:GDP-fucose transporter C1
MSNEKADWKDAEPLLEDSDKPISTAKEPEASTGLVLFSVSFYIVAAIVMVMANKAVLNAVSVPMFFLFCQLVIAGILLQITSALGPSCFASHVLC